MTTFLMINDKACLKTDFVHMDYRVGFSISNDEQAI